jgi:hypothetical protein
MTTDPVQALRAQVAEGLASAKLLQQEVVRVEQEAERLGVLPPSKPALTLIEGGDDDA